MHQRVRAVQSLRVGAEPCEDRLARAAVAPLEAPRQPPGVLGAVAALLGMHCAVEVVDGKVRELLQALRRRGLGG
eukprot:11742060-Alexandrium_andersonii.AAC.1